MTTLTITPITYTEASKLLNLTYFNIRQAAIRGTFKRVPTVGQEQKIIKEQVELFKGKKQLRLNLLTKEEISIWNKYNDITDFSSNTIEETFTPNQVLELISVVNQHTMSNEEKKRLMNVLTIIVTAITLALGLNWIMDNLPLLIDEIIKIGNTTVIEIDVNTIPVLIDKLKKLNNPNPTNIVNLIK